MLRNPLRATCIGGLALLVSMPELLGAQVPFRFEFRPSDQLSVHMIVESEGNLTFVGFPELPDSSTAEFTSRADITRRTMASGGGRFAIRLTYDSVRAQFRMDGSDFRDVALPWDGGLWVEYVADRRMSFTGPTGSNDSMALALVSAAAAAYHLELPEGAIDIGGEWGADFTVPFEMQIPLETPEVITVNLMAPATGLLDSLVVRGADTLAYLSFTGRFLPETVATAYQLGGGPAPAEVWGDVAGRLIWSTGWNAFVSGVMTARINQRFEAVPGSGVEDARITAVITTRIRVRL